jgi:hypothetical protein
MKKSLLWATILAISLLLVVFSLFGCTATKSKIAFASSGEIYIMNANGSEETNLTNNTTMDINPCFLP